ncbi:MAG TPA: oligoendopeptidase F, partial [Methylocella sp.]|nr:oligoendopeptidase F [Methylocella sp.]
MPRALAKKSLGIFRPKPKAEPKSKPRENLGALPEWNLKHLYPAMDSRAFADDLGKAAADCRRFNITYKGKLESLAKKASGAGLFEAIERYEALEELLGRIMAYASLVYAEDTTDPERTKFFGDAQEKVTSASSDLLFFELELNRLDDNLVGKLAAGPLKHYQPWIEDIRKGKPYQLEDKLEQLFHEKSITGYGAWNRLFDETIASLRFRVDGQDLAIEPVLNLMQDPDGKTREKAAYAFGAVLKANLRTFALITNTLAKDKE